MRLRARALLDHAAVRATNLTLTPTLTLTLTLTLTRPLLDHAAVRATRREAALQQRVPGARCPNPGVTVS
jgi:hypothetical protein